MSFINDLRRKALGIFPSEGNAGDMSAETAMDVNYDPNQTFTDSNFGQKGRNPNSYPVNGHTTKPICISRIQEKE